MPELIQSVLGHVNTPSSEAFRIGYGMADTRADRLRQARKAAGYSSASEAARAFGWQDAAYRHHENGIRNFGPDKAKSYGRAFKVKPSWLLGLDRNPDLPEPIGADLPEQLTVSGSVAAGVWRESEQWADDHRIVLEGSQSPIPKAKRFGLMVEGRSMDQFYEPGTVLDCMSIFTDKRVAPQTGDHVIVERRRPDGLRELTVKEYQIENGRYFLVPRSSRPEFRDRMEIGEPDHDHVGDDEVRVVAFVLGAYPPRTLDLMRRMGVKVPAIH